MRNLIDTFLRFGIKLCMLTGVAFTSAACYGPAPERRLQDDPAYLQDHQKVEQQLQNEAEQDTINTQL